MFGFNFGFLKRFLGDNNEKEIKRLQKTVDKINALEAEFQNYTDDKLSGMTEKFRDRLQAGETLDDILPEAFAVCREGSRRVLGMRHFDVQLMGGMCLHEGKIAEMKTGEGKTLVATLPVYLNALEARASTWSPSTTTLPAATANGWGNFTTSWA